MGKYAYKIFALSVLLGGSSPLFAQPNTLYFMQGIPQTKDLNPARPGITSGFYFSMPLFSKLDLAANANNWSYNDVIHRGTGTQKDSLVVDLNKFRGKIGEKNFVYEAAALTVLEAGYKKDKDFFAFSLSEREFAQTFFDKKLVDLIQFGNYPYLGSTFYSGNFGVGAQHYTEFAFNYSRDVTKKLTMGIAAKILFGLSAVQTDGINFKGTSPANNEYLDVSATGKVNISAPVEFRYNALDEITGVYSLPDYRVGKYLKNFGNPGIAFDLGFAYKVNKTTEFSASVIDLGAIVWKTNVTRLTEHGQYHYLGIDLKDPTQTPPVVPLLKPLADQLSDLMAAAFRPGHEETQFTTLLPTKIYFGINHQVSDVVSIAGLSRLRIINNTVHTALTASANALIANTLSLSASYSVLESTYDNLGLGVGIKIAPFQIYAAADNIVSPFYPTTARNLSLRIGINFIFNDENRNKKTGKNGHKVKSDCNCPY